MRWVWLPFQDKEPTFLTQSETVKRATHLIGPSINDTKEYLLFIWDFRAIDVRPSKGRSLFCRETAGLKCARPID